MISRENPLNILRRDYRYKGDPKEIDLSELGDSFCIGNKGVIQKINVGKREYTILGYMSFDMKASGKIATTVMLYDGNIRKEFMGKIKFFDESLRDTLVVEKYRGERWGYLLSDICLSCMGKYNGSNVSNFYIYKVMKGNDSWAPIARMRLNYGFVPCIELEQLKDFWIHKNVSFNEYGKPYLSLNGFSYPSIKLVLKDERGRGIEDIEFYDKIASMDSENQRHLIRRLFSEDKLYLGNIDYKLHPTKVKSFKEYLDFLPEPAWYGFLRRLIE
ncbi:MAG: hypothetical protein ACE5K4_07180 [Candidatus Hydrothermarchaeota archaeon]